MTKPRIFDGKKSSDARGSVSFINSFTFPRVKRFYHVQNLSTKIIRAFHGHMKEEKYVYVAKGKILLCAVALTDKNSPSIKSPVYRFFLSADKPQIVHIPKGYANGFKSLEKSSSVIFFSTKTLEESLKDDYRFPYDYWGENVWKYEKKT